jgi:hypothetical protein
MTVNKVKAKVVERNFCDGGLRHERNELVQSHVYSEPDGRQQLIYQGKDRTRTWSVGEIDDLAHSFENSSIVLRDLVKEIWNI